MPRREEVMRGVHDSLRMTESTNKEIIQPTSFPSRRTYRQSVHNVLTINKTLLVANMGTLDEDFDDFDINEGPANIDFRPRSRSFAASVYV